MYFVRLVVGMTLLFLGLVSCEKNELMGEEILAAPDDFVVKGFSASTHSVNFLQSEVYFEADFSEEVTATILLKGEESGAEKKINILKSSELNEFNGSWKGDHDGMYFFQQGEGVVVELSFYGHKEKYYDTIKIVKMYDFNSVAKNNGVEQSITDWQTWSPNIYGNYLNKELSGRSNEILATQGNYCYRLKSVDNCPKTYLGGGDFELKENSNGFITFQSNEVWFNCYVYSKGECEANIIISLEEADAGFDKAIPSKTDNLNWVIPANFQGWKLFSIQYNKIPFATIPQFGGSGNKLREPNRIDRIAFQVKSLEESNDVDVAFDFFTFTEGKPFQP